MECQLLEAVEDVQQEPTSGALDSLQHRVDDLADELELQRCHTEEQIRRLAARVARLESQSPIRQAHDGS